MPTAGQLVHLKSLSGVIFSCLRLSGARLPLQMAISTRFDNAVLSNVIFENVAFEGCSFSFSKFTECVFDSCKFLKCNLFGASFTRCSLQSSVIKPLPIVVTSAFDMQNCTFGLCDMTDVELDSSGGGIQVVNPIVSPVLRRFVRLANPIAGMLFGTPAKSANFRTSGNRSGATIYNMPASTNNSTHYPSRSSYSVKTRAVAEFSSPEIMALFNKD